MTIYHIDKYYEGDKEKYYVSPYSLKGIFTTYLMKHWILDNSGKSKRNIRGLLVFLKNSSFNKKKLEKKI